MSILNTMREQYPGCTDAELSNALTTWDLILKDTEDLDVEITSTYPSDHPLSRNPYTIRHPDEQL